MSISSFFFHSAKFFPLKRRMQLRQIDSIIYLTILLLLVISPDIHIRVALATQTSSMITLDSEFDCGNKYWGVKNINNKVSANPSIPTFGRLSSDCTEDIETQALPENGEGTTRSYTRLHAETANPSDQSIAWQAAFQGTDPWGVKATRDGLASANNNLFPLSSVLNYTLDVSYLWLDDDNSRPHGPNDRVKGNILVNLWFTDNLYNYSSSSDDSNQQSNNVLVIDLAFANLENMDARWRQDPSVKEGMQYYKPFVERGEHGELVYHYNIVIDAEGINPGVWNHVLLGQYPKSLNEIISDAFNYGYTFNDGTSAPSLNRQNFSLVNIEAGAEVLNDSGASGELIASFSLCNLSYMQTRV